MKHYPDSEVLDVLSLVFLVLLVGGTLMTVWKQGTVERECLQLGYRDSAMTWAGWGTAYCINRQDQTDVVTPLTTARRTPVRTQ